MTSANDNGTQLRLLAERRIDLWEWFYSLRGQFTNSKDRERFREVQDVLARQADQAWREFSSFVLNDDCEAS